MNIKIENFWLEQHNGIKLKIKIINYLIVALKLSDCNSKEEVIDKIKRDSLYIFKRQEINTPIYDWLSIYIMKTPYVGKKVSKDIIDWLEFK